MLSGIRVSDQLALDKARVAPEPCEPFDLHFSTTEGSSGFRRQWSFGRFCCLFAIRAAGPLHRVFLPKDSLMILPATLITEFQASVSSLVNLAFFTTDTPLSGSTWVQVMVRDSASQVPRLSAMCPFEANSHFR
jgi:hypothetical protein